MPFDRISAHMDSSATSDFDRRSLQMTATICKYNCRRRRFSSACISGAWLRSLSRQGMRFAVQQRARNLCVCHLVRGWSPAKAKYRGRELAPQSKRYGIHCHLRHKNQFGERRRRSCFIDVQMRDERCESLTPWELQSGNHIMRTVRKRRRRIQLSSWEG